MRTIPRKVLWVVLVLVLGTACLCNPAGLIPLDTEPTESSAPPVTEAPLVQLPPATEAPLATAGPRLLFTTDEGLWSIAEDGSGLTHLSTEFWQRDLEGALQPDGELLALVTSSGDQVHGLTLKLVSLASGQVRKSIPLTTPDTEPALEATPGDDAFEAVRAIMMDRRFAWSPDGGKLAFIGVLDGPDAEVYLYDLGADTIQRVSDDEAQDYQVSWSPDGGHIFYLEAYAFGTGAGYAMAGAWAADGDGTNPTFLFDPEGSAEELIGWREAQTAVLASWSVVCGLRDLRLVNLVTGSTLTLHSDCFGSAAASTPQGDTPGAVMFTTPRGVYFLPSDGQETYRLDDRLAHDVRWEPGSYVFIIPYIEYPWETTNAYADWFEVAPATAEDVAAFGLIWAWTNRSGELPGVWISGPGMELGQIFYSPAYMPVWDRNHNTLFFCSDGNYGTQLFSATFDRYYSDAAPFADLPGQVEEMIWVDR